MSIGLEICLQFLTRLNPHFIKILRITSHKGEGMENDINERLAHQCFSHPDDRESLVWRYMPLAKLISLLQTSQLYLARLDMLNDPHEGAIPYQQIATRKLQSMQLGMPDMDKHSARFNQRVKGATFVSCWSLNQSESEALWRLYTQDTDGVAIQTTYQALIDAIAPHDYFYIGKINYINYESQWFPAGNSYYPVMHKRRAFAHEQEVRIVKTYMDQHPFEYEKPFATQGLRLPINIENVIKAIYISPYADEWYADVVKSVVEKFAPLLISKIYWSKMKVAPFY